MTKRDQRRFVSDLLNIRQDIHAAIQQGLIPRSWDGIELREILQRRPNGPAPRMYWWDNGCGTTTTTSRSLWACKKREETIIDEAERQARVYWTHQGVDPAVQAQIVADLTAKAQSGAWIGLFQIPYDSPNTGKRKKKHDDRSEDHLSL